MKTTRRAVLGGSGAIAGLAASGLARPAIADSGPIRLGWLPALTGASSSTGIGIGRGVDFAAKEINAAGGVKGRMIEVIARDTQSDPTKAVNATVELIRQQNVMAIAGPGNSGESLAVTPIMARSGVVQIDPCWVDELINVEKYPLAFRTAPSNTQVGAAANRFVVDVLKLKKIALVSDTTGYGTASVKAYAPMLQAKGATLVYQDAIEASNPDVKADLLRMRDAGAEVIMPWSVNAGFLARLINTRAQMGWDVPIAGQTTLGSGQTKALIEKPEYWRKVYAVNFRSAAYDAQGHLPPHTTEFVERLHKAKLESADTLLWWIACGHDMCKLVADAMKSGAGSPKEIGEWLNTVKNYDGAYASYSFSPQNHNGFPDDDVIMVQANSFRDGTFQIAPGYV